MCEAIDRYRPERSLRCMLFSFQHSFDDIRNVAARMQ